MEYTNAVNRINDEYNIIVLKEMFDKCADDNISDEQLNRILEPVLIMIKSGKFEKSRRMRFVHFVKNTFHLL